MPKLNPRLFMSAVQGSASSSKEQLLTEGNQDIAVHPAQSSKLIST